MIVSITF